jgi:hypothetical protein
VAQTDPFTDSVFVARLQKLLSLLGSGQASEADVARRKLMEHLSQQGLTLLDLAQRLQAPAGARGVAASSAREDSLERQLAVARAAKEEAQTEARLLGQRLQSLQIELQQQEFDVGHVLQGQGKARALAIAGWVAAAFCLGIAVLQPKIDLAPHRHQQDDVKDFVKDGPPTLQTDDPGRHVAQGERAGTAAVQDLPIRLGPSDSASVRAFINQGEHVAILQQLRVGQQTWLLIRTASGEGWARAGDVLH